MRFISLIFCLFISAMSFGQNGQITIDADPRIDSLMKKQLEFNKDKHGIEGFRVQIHFGQNREKAQQIRTKFSKDFIELKTYLEYDSPYYKIRVGDFITRLNAYKVQKEISKKYVGTYIVPAVVDYEEVIKKEG